MVNFGKYKVINSTLTKVVLKAIPPSQVKPHEWHHACLVHDRGSATASVRTYLDGEVLAEGTCSIGDQWREETLFSNPPLSLFSDTTDDLDIFSLNCTTAPCFQVVLGQEQDAFGYKFQDTQSFTGEMADIRFYSRQVFLL